MAERIILTTPLSAYRHAYAKINDDPDELGSVGPLNSVVFTLPERAEFEELEDTTIHIALGGEFLWDVATQYYKDVRWKPIDVVEFLAGWQPTPITDYSVPLYDGQEIHLPPPDYIDEVFNGIPLIETPKV